MSSNRLLVSGFINVMVLFLFKNLYKNYHKPQNPFELET